MKRRSSMFVLVLSLALGCSERAAQRVAPPEVSSPISADSAVVLARTLLAAAPDASEHLLDSTQVFPTDSSWHVLIDRTDWQQRRPGFALIEVDRHTGRAVRIRVR